MRNVGSGQATRCSLMPLIRLFTEGFLKGQYFFNWFHMFCPEKINSFPRSFSMQQQCLRCRKYFNFNCCAYFPTLFSLFLVRSNPGANFEISLLTDIFWAQGILQEEILSGHGIEITLCCDSTRNAGFSHIFVLLNDM